MNAYDFDKTIYNGDSTVDFYQYCLLKYPSIAVYLPKQVRDGFQYVLGKISTTEFKESFFSFLPKVSSLDIVVEKFWDLRQRKIKEWYLKQKQCSDVVISASPSFLLTPICERLNIMPPIATEVDPLTGRINGANCKGEEKVRRFFARYPGEKLQRFYSDSITDAPLAALAEEAFFVQGDIRSPWNTQL